MLEQRRTPRDTYALSLIVLKVRFSRSRTPETCFCVKAEGYCFKGEEARAFFTLRKCCFSGCMGASWRPVWERT